MNLVESIYLRKSIFIHMHKYDNDWGLSEITTITNKTDI